MAPVRLRWRHVIINTHCSWLQGDPRGFRSRDHRIHSSGDYRKPPPKGEHEDLHRNCVSKSSSEVHLNRSQRAEIGRAICAHFETREDRVLVIAVTKVHAHFLVELPDDMPLMRAIVGEAKRTSSRAVKRDLPGAVWGRGAKFEPVDTRGHQRAAYNYILYDQGSGAWTWCFQDKNKDGRFGRVDRRKK